MIYVLLPVHNRRSITMGFARCLAQQTDTDWHLVLIDDGSSDGTAEAVTALLPNSTVLRGVGNWWWAGSLQQGYRWLKRQALSGGDVVLIANDDTRFDSDFLAQGRSVLARNRRSLVLAQLHDQPAGPLVEVGVHVDWHAMRFEGVMDPETVNCFSTRGLFVFAREFVELGGFHPHLLPHYGSDYEFTIRAHRVGFALRSDPAVRLWYDETTTGIREASTESVAAYLRTTFSTRSTVNPLYLTTFLLLSCPPRNLPRNLLRVYRRFLTGFRASMASKRR